MRQAHESSDEVLPRDDAGAASQVSLREVAPLFGFAMACYLVAPWLGLDSREVDPRIAEIWPTGVAGFVVLTTVWYAGRQVVAGTLAVMVVAFAVTAIAMGYPPLMAFWLALTGAAQPLLMAAIYRRALGRPGWSPERPHDVGALFLAAVVTSLALGLVGGFPFLTPDDLPSKVLLWWVLRNTVFCFVGGVTFMVIYYGRRSDVLPSTPWANRVALLVASFLCVYGTYHDPSLPLSWLLIVPSVWGGLTLTVRGTAYLALTVALLAASMTYLPQNRFGYTGLLPAASIVDLLMVASTAFMLLLSLMREQRATLIAELDRKGAESERRRQLLETVFDSMKDGVVILDEARQVSMWNSAARQLLGRPMPATNPTSWSAAFDLRDEAGNLLEDEALREVILAPPEAEGSRSLEVLVGHDGAARVLDLSAQPVGAGEDRPTMLLLHDVTAERARLRELSNFAGTVAHDLRGPLTVLEGWLEVVSEGTPADGSDGADAVTRARDASLRMRQVIDDWMSYTVVQNGRLHPDAVKLEQVASEIAESRESHWADGDAPRFLLDLTHSVQADPAMLRQVLDNLVGNAIKYTAADEPPWVQIVSRQDAEPGWVRVEVTDHGIGIPVGQEEQIFQEFHRGPVEGRTAGSGLGLALTRRIVSLHGGELTGRRNPGRGSTFSFTLPEA
jgi:signal transduction histidine kinase